MNRRLLPTALSLAAIALSTFAHPTPLAAQSFGEGVVINGDQILVAATRGMSGGAVYIYSRSGDTWVETGRLTHPDPAEGDGFGTSMAASGDRLLVTSFSPFPPPGTGAIHSYVRAGPEWRHDGMIAVEGLPEGMLAGQAVVLSEDRAALNASAGFGGDSRVLVFRHTDGDWIQEAVLESPGGETGTGFGGTLALSDDMLVVGAPGADSATGAAYVYERGSGGWTMTAELSRAAGGPGTLFGVGALIAGDRILVAAGNPFDQVGSVTAFARQEGEWTETATVQAFDGGPGDRFGGSMASDGGTLWIGAAGVNSREGAIYQFTPDAGGAFTSVSKITLPDPQPGEGMGNVLAQAGDLLVSGMPGADYAAGRATVFERDGDSWRAGPPIFTEIEEFDPVVGGQLDCSDGEASVFGCNDVDLVAYLPVSALGGERGTRLNDIWGWTDPETQRDYALVGRMDGTSFVDVTDPANPVVVGNLPRTEGIPGTSWRDMKVYSDHVFVVSDIAGAHGMQVFDLTRLRDFAGTMITFDEDAHYDRIASVHNIVINEETGFAYAVGSSGGGDTCGGGLHMIDVRDPKNPTFAGCFADPNTGRAGTGYTHDAQCVIYRGPDEEHRGKEICFGANENALSIADVSDKANPVALSTANYPNIGYTHQGWLTRDHAYFLMGDETDEFGAVDNTRTLIYDVKDLDEPLLVKEFFTENTSSDHNLYIVDDLMFQSNYNSGLRVFDVSDPENPREVGFFDTVPGADSPAMRGSWSNYPFFRSGIVVVTSMGEGLFIVRKRGTPIS